MLRAQVVEERLAEVAVGSVDHLERDVERPGGSSPPPARTNHPPRTRRRPPVVRSSPSPFAYTSARTETALRPETGTTHSARSGTKPRSRPRNLRHVGDHDARLAQQPQLEQEGRPPHDRRRRATACGRARGSRPRRSRPRRAGSPRCTRRPRRAARPPARGSRGAGFPRPARRSAAGCPGRCRGTGTWIARTSPLRDPAARTRAPRGSRRPAARRRGRRCSPASAGRARPAPWPEAVSRSIGSAA